MKPIKLLPLIFALMLSVLACTEKNEPAAPAFESDRISGKTIKYSLQVGSNSLLKSSAGLFGAQVSLAMDDTVITRQTDSSGIAHFDNLASGSIAISVEANAHYACLMLVDLSYPADSVVNDSENYRNAASFVVLPAVSSGLATIAGSLKADTDLQATGTELMSKPVNIYLGLIQDNIRESYRHEGIGAIQSVSYEMPVFETTATDGYYQVQIPGGQMSLTWIISADDVQLAQLQADGGTIERGFLASRDSLRTFLPKIYWHNILYKSAE